ncbi:hypothetical protein ONS95_012729 [Cadophora gregata]|uniref:uncharacterized protein n=1 Tax=Cadophora gregata TaxID=51156 RepID=UPI0026DBA424|nr:uncharacterized protein ONS95_012729 [Cadophora gregata]KAK0118444.1 hypothetical protein ONS95_012729 [Cadophora gregata]KAK0123511.1 hypothetical protein ONS96_010493 [Cadophora gregata f. sp. sojae]
MNQFLALLSHEEKQLVMYPIDAPQRRAWANPELYLFRNGIRLENVDETVRTAVHSVIQSTFSPEGFQKALSAMKTNEFLGELVNAPGVLNMHSYNFLTFGNPSTTEPFGWLLYGHHLCLSVFVWKTQIVVAPTFVGAEPNVIDRGPHQGTQILQSEQDLGLRFMKSLSKDLQSKAQIFKTLQPPEIPEDRWNPADQRHLCGACQDNRIVPYEGISVGGLEPSLVQLLLQIVEQFIIYLPAQARKNKLAQVERHIQDTHFCWIGGFTNDDPFYYRIQSPVIVVEFDHHSAVFLTNTEPARFHTHTIVRNPNGGDYGYALLNRGKDIMGRMVYDCKS